MKIGNLSGRAVLIEGDVALDIETASHGRFPADPQAIWGTLHEFKEWQATELGRGADGSWAPFDDNALGTPVPRPAQIFAIGLNYADHARESNLDIPANPVVFTKFPSSLAGPHTSIRLPSETVDWEAELVIVVGTGGRDIPESAAWDAVAGLTVGQDLSDRTVQNWGKPAQFSLGKSFAQFAPVGPVVVSVDEVASGADIDSLQIRCWVQDGDEGVKRILQEGTTADLLFSVPQLISRLSAVVELLPGDLIFTGTPSGVGIGRSPKVFLQPGQVLTTEIEALGTIQQTFTN